MLTTIGHFNIKRGGITILWVLPLNMKLCHHSLSDEKPYSKTYMYVVHVRNSVRSKETW